MKRNLLFALQLLCTLFTLSACAAGYPPAYSAEAIEAQVIDTETKQPLEGVIIAADWELRGGASPGGSTAVGELMVMEAVTDKNGRFSFPAWGPIRQSKGELHNRDPRLILFKSGYRYEILSNKSRFEAEAALEPVRRSQWNGKTIELKPFKGTAEEYAEHVHNLDNETEFARYGDNCEWKKVPRLLAEVHRLSEQFDSKGIKLRGWQIGARVRKVTDVGSQNRCGSAEEFFKSYLP